MAWNRSNNGEAASRSHNKDGSSSDKSVGTRFPTLNTRRVALGVLIVIVAAIGGWFALRPSQRQTSNVKRQTSPALIKEAKPAAAPRAAEPVKTDDAPAPTSVQTNAEKEIVVKPGTIYAIDPREKARQQAQPKVFKTGLEAMLTTLFSIEIGDAPPMALPKLSKGEMSRLADILVSKEQIGKDDTEDVKVVKETLDFAKGEYRQYIKNGGDPELFMEFCRQELQQAYDQRKDAQREVMKFAKEVGESDPEMLRDYIDKVDATLKEKGIKPITHNKKIKMLLGESLEDQKQGEQ